MPESIASRFSSVRTYQENFIKSKYYEDTKDFIAEVELKAKGRNIEWDRSAVNPILNGPEAFYFFGNFFPISGITSPTMNIWTSKDLAVWRHTLLNSKYGCVVFDANMPDSNLFPNLIKNKEFALTVDTISAGKKHESLLVCKDSKS
jgi:hypothetical protein